MRKASTGNGGASECHVLGAMHAIKEGHQAHAFLCSCSLCAWARINIDRVLSGPAHGTLLQRAQLNGRNCVFAPRGFSKSPEGDGAIPASTVRLRPSEVLDTRRRGHYFLPLGGCPAARAGAGWGDQSLGGIP